MLECEIIASRAAASKWWSRLDFRQPMRLAITLCRYYAIAAPLHYAALVSPRRVVVGLAASWTGALLLCLPPFSGLVPPYRFVHTCYTISYHTRRRRIPRRRLLARTTALPRNCCISSRNERDSIYFVFRPFVEVNCFASHKGPRALRDNLQSPRQLLATRTRNNSHSENSFCRLRIG